MLLITSLSIWLILFTICPDSEHSYLQQSSWQTASKQTSEMWVQVQNMTPVAKQKQGATIYFCQLLRWYLVIWSDVHSKALFSGSSQYWPVILAGWTLLLMLRKCAQTFWPEDFRWMSKLCKLEIGIFDQTRKSI